MANFDYSSFKNFDSAISAEKDNKPKNKCDVGYFSINDGEEAIVRFIYSSAKEFDIVTVHNVKVGKVWRKISCLRDDATKPLNVCPLCEHGTPTSSRFFIKLLHYVKDENGKIVAKPEIANFPQAGHADTLAKYIEEFGDLKNSVFKIRRTGTKTDTKYSIEYANPVKYTEEAGYTKDFSAFNNLDLAHHDYQNKTFDDMKTYLETGDFPYKKKSETSKKEEVAEALDTSELSVKASDLQSEDDVNTYLENRAVEETPKAVEVDIPHTPSAPVVEKPVAPAPVVETKSETVAETTTTNTAVRRPRRSYDFIEGNNQ